MRFEALGDQGVVVYCDDEARATEFAGCVRRSNASWLLDVVQAYLSVALFYDLSEVDYFDVVQWVSNLPAPEHFRLSPEKRACVIPCCYELGLDLERVEKHTGMDREQVIERHVQAVYRVYAIGFCPGFPYLGYLPPALAGLPRLNSPRLRVEAGSVGLTGRQTGIYTETRPGGWNIIGRTPLELVNVKEEYFPLRTGDEVRFRRIDEREYARLTGQRLSQ